MAPAGAVHAETARIPRRAFCEDRIGTGPPLAKYRKSHPCRLGILSTVSVSPRRFAPSRGRLPQKRIRYRGTGIPRP